MLKLADKERSARVAAENNTDAHERLARGLAMQCYLDERRTRVCAAVEAKPHRSTWKTQEECLDNVRWLLEHVPAHTCTRPQVHSTAVAHSRTSSAQLAVATGNMALFGGPCLQLWRGREE
jgi:hypothetical protein